MRCGKLLLLVIVVLVYLSVHCASEERRIDHNEAGISIVVPQDWHLLSRSDINSAPDRYDLPTDRLKSAAQGVIIKFAKYAEPTARLNPTVQIGCNLLDPKRDLTATEILKNAYKSARLDFPDFEWIEAPTSAELDGKLAARGISRYTLTTKEGIEYTFLARCWIVPRDWDYVVIVLSGPDPSADALESEFVAILDSFRIRPTSTQ